MPETTPISKADQAGNLATEGQFLKRGEEGLVGALIVTSDVGGLTPALAAKADDDTVVKLDGPQVAAGEKTWTGIQVYDLSVNPTAFVEKIVLPTGSLPVTWNRTVALSHGDNSVVSEGMNWGGSGAIDTTKPWFRDGWEYHYTVEVSPGVFETWMERHVGSYSNPSTQGDIRPLSFQITWNTWKNQAIFQGSGCTWSNEGGLIQYAQLSRTSDGSVFFKVCGNNSSDPNGYLIQAISDAASPQDTINFGRKAGINNAVKIFGSTANSLQFTVGTNTTSLIKDGTNFSIVNPAGGLLYYRSDDHVFCSRDTARLGLRLQDTGAAMKAGFFGATTVTRLSGDVATGLVSVGLFSTATLAVASGTSGRVVIETTGGVLTDSANLTFNGTVLGANSLAIGGGTTVTRILSATAPLDFGATAAQTSSDLTVSVTGAAVGDSVSLGLPAAPPANTNFSAWVNAADTVTVRFCNFSSVSVDPSSGTYRVTVLKF